MNGYDKECVESMQKLIGIKSVRYDGDDEYVPVVGRPFGNGIADALEYVLGLCASMGMRTKNCGGYAGYAEVGEGEELIGILCHLDVVPEGNGWDYPPFGGEIHDGRLYGRGAIDDKGPAMAVVYALKALMDEGFDFGKRVRIIFGADEECDWEDMEYYTANEECPAMGFTPDADFPLIYGEMGILQLDFVIEFSRANNLIIEGGEASNAVPDYCRVTAAGGSGDASSIDKTGGGCCSGVQTLLIDEAGTAAHASVPWEGENAISKAMSKLQSVADELDITDEMKRFIEFYCSKIGFNIHGEGMGCDFEDEESGRLTFNAGRIRADERSMCLSVDIRCPVTVEKERVLAALEHAAADFGFELRNVDWLKPVYSSCESQLVKTLLEVYRETTGDMGVPLTMGGGTYARAMDNIVAFGPVFPGREATEHMKNEYILLEDLVRIREIYEEAIRRLCRL